MPTQNSRSGEALDLTKLSDYIEASSVDFGKLLHVEQFRNGFSNLTYRLDTDKGQFVMRRPPFGPRAEKAHDMEREFRILVGLSLHFLLSNAIMHLLHLLIRSPNFTR